MLTTPIALRRTEALIVFLLGLAVYYHSGFSWVVFGVLFFLPDAGAIGYLKSHSLGSTLYNLTHWMIWPLMLGTYGLLHDDQTAKMVAIIWITHIAFDRMLGWGFKTGGSFYETGMGLKKSARRTPAHKDPS
jgi:hypothetical protein